MTQDDELYARYLSGDSSAVDDLMRKYTGRLIMYLDAMVHNIRDAEDLVIETFAAIMTKRPAIREGGFQAYLYQAARNRTTRFRLRRRKISTFSLDEDEAEQLQAVRPEDEFLRDEQRIAVRNCLNRIDPECREAIWLTYFEGLSYAEAAAVMGTDAKRIDNLLIKGKRNMRSELEKEGILCADN